MRTCEEYVIQRLENAESALSRAMANYESLQEMYDHRMEDIQFLLKFFKKATTSDGHSYYKMSDLITEQYDQIAYSTLTDLIEKFGEEEPVES